VSEADVPVSSDESTLALAMRGLAENNAAKATPKTTIRSMGR
jgi:hypothetical protein